MGEIYPEQQLGDTFLRPVYRIPGIGDPVPLSSIANRGPHHRPNYELRAKLLVMNHINDNLEANDMKQKIFETDLFVVWFCKTLENWKCLVTTAYSTGRYYEISYSGAKQETYIDVYNKTINVCIPDEV